MMIFGRNICRIERGTPFGSGRPSRISRSSLPIALRKSDLRLTLSRCTQGAFESASKANPISSSLREEVGFEYRYSSPQMLHPEKWRREPVWLKPVPPTEQHSRRTFITVRAGIASHEWHINTNVFINQWIYQLHA